MFCPKCGAKVDDNDSFCADCGFKLKENTDVQNQYAFKLEYDYADSERETDLNTVPSAEFEFVPSVQTVPAEKNKKTAVRILAAVLAVIFIAAAAFSAYYFTSENYKIEKTENLIANGEYANAVNELAGLSSEKANVMRNYVILSQSVSQFKENCIGSGYNIVSGDNAFLADNMNNIITQIESFADTNDVSKLPEALNIEYNFYRKACESVKNIDLKSELCSAQMSVVNVAIYGSKEKFTLDELKSRSNKSKAAAAALDTSLQSIVDITKKDNAFIDFSAQEFVNLHADYNRFATACNDAVKASEKLISENKKTNSKTKIYNKSGKDNFKVELMHDLKPVSKTSYDDDIAANAEIMNNTIQLSVFEYYLIYS